jgi:hypothetical protein
LSMIEIYNPVNNGKHDGETWPTFLVVK